MNLRELHSFSLADAVKFHDELNPKLFSGQHLNPTVRKKLLVIAEDFINELGISKFKVKDVTISGSNAAYSYTDHSDIDLHIIVDMDQFDNDEVYKELFNAKKSVYNDKHDIKIKNIPVELYVQPSDEPHVSLGEYSVLNNEWIKTPVKRRANFDQNNTKLKYIELKGLCERALKERNLRKVVKAIDKIKRYRKAGLANFGEFGPENLAYKMLRTQGYIQKLYDLRDKLHSEKLSFETMYQNPLKQDVTETFNQPYPIKWEKSEVGNSQDALATLDDGSPLSIMFHDVGNDQWQVEFYRNNSQGITGKGDSQRVFATVLNAISKFIKKNKPSTLFFGSVREDPKGSRTKLYDRLVQKYANQLGYDVNKVEHPETTDFNLIRKDQSVAESGAETYWSDGTEKITLQDILELTKHIKPINLQINDTLKSKLLHWDGNPKEIERINQVTVSNQFPILIMVDEQGQIEWILDGNHRLHKAIQAQAKTIPAKLIKPSDLSDKAKKIFNIKEQGVAEASGYIPSKSVKLYTDPDYYGADVDDTNLKNLPTVNIPLDKLVGYEPDSKMNSEESKKKLKNIISKLKQEKSIPPILVRQYNNGYQVLDGHHRYHAYKLLNKKTIPAKLVPDTDIETMYQNPLKQGVAEGTSKTIPKIGINVRSDGDIDYASLIVDGKKKYESRKTDSLRPYVGKTVGIVRTGNGPAVAIGQATIGEPIIVDADKFDKLRNQHLIPKNSKFDIDIDGTKYLYPVINPIRWDVEKPIKHKGIVSRKIQEQGVAEGSGYIPSNAQKNDPRFKTALTVDVKPDSIKKNAKAFGFKTSRAGIPPQARPDGKV